MVLVRDIEGDVVQKRKSKPCTKQMKEQSVDLSQTRPITDVEALYIVQAMREQK